MKAKNFGGYIFAGVGLLFFIIGMLISVSSLKFKSDAATVQGTITSITAHKDSDGDTSHTVTVSYNYEGVPYSTSLSTYSSTMREGKSIKLYVDTKNPRNVGSDYDSTFGFIFAGFSLIFIILGFKLIIDGLKWKKEIQRVIEQGYRIQGQVVSTVVDSSITINGENPMKYICRDINNREYISDSYMTKDFYLQIGNMVTIFVDRENPEKYYVDAKNEY